MRLEGWKVTALGLVCISIGAASVDAKPAEYNMVPAGTAKFAPADPKQPKGPQVSVISGDPTTGPVTLLLKVPKGPSPIHWHTSDYSAVIVEGTAKHWLQGKDAGAKANGPGTAWFQPGGSAATAHVDECTTDSCTIFIVMPGKFDINVVPPPAKK